MTRSEQTRMDALERKLDEILRLSLENKHHLDGVSQQVAAMQPAWEQVANALTFAKVGKSFFRWTIGAGMVIAPVVWWVSDRWSIISQLFKRA